MLFNVVYSATTQLQLCTNLNQREFTPCYQWPALLPAGMKHFSAQEVRYGGGSGWGRRERREYLDKKKDAKQLVLCIPNLSFYCLQHFLNVGFPYVFLKLLMGGDSVISSERQFFQFFQMSTYQSKKIASDEDFLSQSSTRSKLGCQHPSGTAGEISNLLF